MSRASSGIYNVENVSLFRLFGNYLRQTTGIIDNYPVTSAFPSFLFIKATTTRDVLLPFVDATVDGMLLFVYNEGSGTITFKTSSDAALTPPISAAGAAAGTASAAVILQAVATGVQVTTWRKMSAT